MRYSASEKAEIIRLVGQSALPVKRTLEKLGIPRATFYRWYDRYQSGGPEALDDRSPRPNRVWNRIPDDIRERIVQLALDEPALSPRKLAVRFTDTEKYFVSEASVYRLLKAHDLIASPAFIVMKANASKAFSCVTAAVILVRCGRSSIASGLPIRALPIRRNRSPFRPISMPWTRRSNVRI